MKGFSFRLLVISFTLFFSVGFTLLWQLYSYVPEVTNDEIEGLEWITSNCSMGFLEELQISEEDKRFWNQQILKRFDERPLEELFPESKMESYRFVLLPTFDQPVAVRVDKSNDGYFLIVKQLSGEGGFGIKKFGRLAANKKRKLTAEEWQNFQNLFEKSGFWDMSPLENEDPVNDGATWIMEANSNGIYTEVHRITPDKDFQKSCIYLLKLAGLEKQYNGYWE